MKQKLLTLLFATVASVGTLFAESGTCGENLTWELTDGVLTISGTGDMENYTFQNNAPWYENKESIKSVILSNGVTTIGDWAFYDCTGLTSVTIPNSVTSIGEGAFCACSGLTYVAIPNSVTSIGERAFQRCTGLTSIEIPGSVTSIGGDAFYLVCNIKYSGTATGSPWGARSKNGFVDGYCIYSDENKTELLACSPDAKGEINIPNSVTSISEYAFYECKSLSSVIIPNSVKSIERYTFSGCTGLTSVTIPNSVTSIGYDAFGNCYGLTSLTIPNSVTSIGSSAFYGCSGLTSVTIPNSVTSIGNEAFYWVPNIEYSGTASGSPWGARSVNGFVDGYFVYKDNTKTILLACSSAATGEIKIPNSVTSIGYETFWYCTGLTSIKIPNSVTSIGDVAFIGCIGLTEVNIPNSVTSIGEFAFSYCYGLKSISIGSGVTSIGDGAFLDCTALTSVTLNSNAIVSKKYNYYNDLETIFGSQVTEYIIGDDVKSIGEYAFSACERLTSVTIGNNVTSIGSYAFYDCHGLKSVSIGSGVTSIESKAFSYCSGLKSVSIGSGVTSIEDGAFLDCTALTAVHINDLAAWCRISFSSYDPYSYSSVKANPLFYAKHLYLNDTEITDLVIPDGVTSIGNNAFYNCEGLTSVTIPNSVTSIGNYAFYGCSGLTSVTIPNSITSIGGDAFYNCENLAKIYFTGNLEEWCTKSWSFIKSYIYYDLYIDNKKVKDVIIPATVTTIGDGAFSGCNSLTSVSMGSNVKTIGSNAFNACKSLTSVTIGKNVKIIEDMAFYYCTGLSSIEFPNSLTSIGLSAFGVCRLVDIVIPASVKTIGAGAFAMNIYDENSETEQYTIKTITCYRNNPPRAGEYLCSDMENVILYVPFGSVETYEENEAWGDFDVQPIEATKIEATDLQVTPTENTANVAWPVVSGAASYELLIKDKSGKEVCTLIFNAEGQLTQIAFAAPAREKVPQQTQAAGFSFTVTGLEAGTAYDLTITAKDNSSKVLETFTDEFRTLGEAEEGGSGDSGSGDSGSGDSGSGSGDSGSGESGSGDSGSGSDESGSGSGDSGSGGNSGDGDSKPDQALDQITNDQSLMTNKIIKDNQILILRGDKTYTLQGQEVR